MSLGANKNIKKLSELREKIASAIKEVEDPTETTPPAVEGEPVETNEGVVDSAQLKDPGPSGDIKNDENNKNLGVEVTKPEDGNAKDEAEQNAEKLASSAKKLTGLMAKIQSNIKKASAESTEETKEEETAEAAPAKEEKKEETSEEAAPAAEETKEEEMTEAEKAATVAELLNALGSNGIAKLAAVVLSSDRLAEETIVEMQKYMDKQAARKMISDAMYQQVAYEDYQIKQAQAMQELEESLSSMEKSASVEDKKLIEKFAKVHNYGMSKFASDIEKQAYMAGAADAATAMDNEDALPIPEEEAVPSVEEIAEVVSEMVETGEISEEEADEILTELAEEELGAEGGAEEMPAPEEELDEETLAALQAAEGEMAM